jgi:hypothetical protein
MLLTSALFAMIMPIHHEQGPSLAVLPHWDSHNLMPRRSQDNSHYLPASEPALSAARTYIMPPPPTLPPHHAYLFPLAIQARVTYYRRSCVAENRQT